MVCGLLLFSWIVQAHEFWLQPAKYRVTRGETLTIDFKAGENFMGEPWKFTPERIKTLQWFHGDKSKDISNDVVTGEKENVRVTLDDEGPHVFALESTESFIALDADKFNEYLKEDGLDEALDYRKKNNLLTDSAREFYSRHSKLIVQVGEKTGDTYKKEVGMPVEIIPLENPYSLKIGDRMRFKIFYNGQPLFGARVKVFNRHNNRTSLQNIYSQKDGIIETTVSTPGRWMVSFVKMIPSKDPKAQWRSYWGSLVFGI
jgi:uncharacterized GH25 family protein